MKKVKHILATFVHSFIPQDIYYPKLLHTRFQFSLNYYFICIAIFSLIFVGVQLYIFSPMKMIGYKNAINTSLSTFPDGVKIKMNKGILESNQSKPLFLWIYYNAQPLFVFMVNPKDTLTNYHLPLPLIFFGADKMQISHRRNSIIRPYDPLLNITISKEMINNLIFQINMFFPFVFFISYILLILLSFVLFGIFSTLIILFSALCTFLLLRTFIPHIHINKCIQAGLHGTHIPLFSSLILFALFPSAINSLTIMTALIFVFTLVSTYEMYSKGVTHFKGR